MKRLRFKLFLILIFAFHFPQAQIFKIVKQRDIAPASFYGLIAVTPSSRSLILQSDCILIANTGANAQYDKTLPGKGGNDFWLIKMDTNLQITNQWDYGGTDEDLLGEVVELKDSSLLLIGTSKSDIGFDKSQNNIGEEDFWIIKTDKNGNKIWDKTYGSTFEDVPVRTVIINDSTYLIMGVTNAWLPNNDVSDTAYAETGWYLVIDSAGNKLKDFRLSRHTFIPLNYAWLPFDLLAVMGTPAWYGIFANDKGGAGTMVVDQSFNVFNHWASGCETCSFCATSFLFDAKTDNFYYAQVQLTNYVFDTCVVNQEFSRGFSDGYICKTDFGGNELVWKRYGNNCSDNISGMIDFNDTLLLTYGYTSSMAGNEISHSAHNVDTACYLRTSDIWLMLVNKNNPSQFYDTLFGGNYRDEANLNSMVRENDSIFYLMAWSNSDSTFEKTTPRKDTAVGNGDIWMLKICISPSALSGVGWHTVERANAPSVFPNPMDDFVTVQCETAEEKLFELYDLQGKIMLQQKLQNAQSKINTSALSDGFYFYKIVFKNGTQFCGKVIKNGQ